MDGPTDDRGITGTGTSLMLGRQSLDIMTSASSGAGFHPYRSLSVEEFAGSSTT